MWMCVAQSSSVNNLISGQVKQILSKSAWFAVVNDKAESVCIGKNLNKGVLEKPADLLM